MDFMDGSSSPPIVDSESHFSNNDESPDDCPRRAATRLGRLTDCGSVRDDSYPEEGAEGEEREEVANGDNDIAFRSRQTDYEKSRQTMSALFGSVDRDDEAAPRPTQTQTQGPHGAVALRSTSTAHTTLLDTESDTPAQELLAAPPVSIKVKSFDVHAFNELQQSFCGSAEVTLCVPTASAPGGTAVLQLSTATKGVFLQVSLAEYRVVLYVRKSSSQHASILYTGCAPAELRWTLMFRCRAEVEEFLALCALYTMLQDSATAFPPRATKVSWIEQTPFSTMSYSQDEEKEQTKTVANKGPERLRLCWTLWLLVPLAPGSPFYTTSQKLSQVAKETPFAVELQGANAATPVASCLHTLDADAPLVLWLTTSQLRPVMDLQIGASHQLLWYVSLVGREPLAPPALPPPLPAKEAIKETHASAAESERAVQRLQRQMTLVEEKMASEDERHQLLRLLLEEQTKQIEKMIRQQLGTAPREVDVCDAAADRDTLLASIEHYRKKYEEANDNYQKSLEVLNKYAQRTETAEQNLGVLQKAADTRIAELKEQMRLQRVETDVALRKEYDRAYEEGRRRGEEDGREGGYRMGYQEASHALSVQPGSVALQNALEAQVLSLQSQLTTTREAASAQQRRAQEEIEVLQQLCEKAQRATPYTFTASLLPASPTTAAAASPVKRLKRSLNKVYSTVEEEISTYLAQPTPPPADASTCADFFLQCLCETIKNEARLFSSEAARESTVHTPSTIGEEMQ